MVIFMAIEYGWVRFVIRHGISNSPGIAILAVVSQFSLLFQCSAVLDCLVFYKRTAQTNLYNNVYYIVYTFVYTIHFYIMCVCESMNFEP